MLFNQKLYQLIVLCSLLLGNATAQQSYKVTIFRAAPGELMALIKEVKSLSDEYYKAYNLRPALIRHSQGDHWDLMVIETLSRGAAKSENTIFTPPFGDKLYNLVAFHESFIAYSEQKELAEKILAEANYFHVEMFIALPAMQQKLLKQRKMENKYLEEIGRQENVIFTMNGDTPWDCFTLGGYRDIKHFAESADIPLEVEEAAARKAGFKGVNDISPYLRSLIDTHNDTLGGRITHN